MTHALTTTRAHQLSTREEGARLREQQSEHVSVLVPEVLEALELHDGEVVVDATLGRAGHSESILKAKKVHLIAIDADPASIEAGKERLRPFAKRVDFIEGNFGELADLLKRHDIAAINKAVFDLGWNATQLQAGRGFSFMHDEPLLMSYGKSARSGFSAAQILNTWSEQGIADALFGYGEERYAKKIAKAVIARREAAPVATTIEFVELIKDAVPASYRRGKIHPATRSFQALRIAVNDELGALAAGLSAAWDALAPGGRIVVITFHSIEDRIVKRLFLSFAKTHNGRLVYKKPLTPAQAELAKNPRARSAKLRAIEKLSTI